MSPATWERSSYEPEIDRPYPWERNVTVCIAAECTDGGERKIVLCSDWKASSSLGSANTMLKLHLLHGAWQCMTSGVDSDIRGLVTLVREQFRKEKNIDETNVVQLVRNAMNVRKKEKMDEATFGKYGMSFDELVRIGNEKLPPDIYRAAVFSASEILLGATLVIAGFYDGKYPFLIETDERCRAYAKGEFAVVGEGKFLAAAVLLQREHMFNNSLSSTLYCVYEAKKYAERVASVGETTTMGILNNKGKLSLINSQGESFLAEKFKKFGPQSMESDIQLEDRFFSDV